MNHRESPSYRQAVRAIQTYLYTVAQFDSDIPRVNPDGIYGPTTADSVAAFQRKYLGRADGRVDYATWQALLTQYRKDAAHLRKPNPILPFLGPLKDRKISLGDRSDLVLLIRYLLESLSLDYRSEEPLLLSDRFDAALADRIKVFQIAQGLPPDGEVDRDTWDRLALAFNQSITNNE
ncbi:MAG: peptidoglycan-binding protein [Ruminococcaceae bacterium]|nr:peptidoglycan-binding protein [Oscillospiraceae bacterium]